MCLRQLRGRWTIKSPRIRFSAPDQQGALVWVQFGGKGARGGEERRRRLLVRSLTLLLLFDSVLVEVETLTWLNERNCYVWSVFLKIYFTSSLSVRCFFVFFGDGWMMKLLLLSNCIELDIKPAHLHISAWIEALMASHSEKKEKVQTLQSET